MIGRLLLLFCFISFFLTNAKAQEIRFKHLSREDGLSQSRINCILQDSKGFLWFGTDDGLNRYNGQSFTIFRNDLKQKNSITDNWILSIHEDSQGVLWIGTKEGGLNKYDRLSNSFTSFQSKNEDENSISNDQVNVIIQRDENSLWVGTENGLNILDKRTGKFERFKDEMVHANNPKLSIRNDQIRALYQDTKGVLWIGTYKAGLLSYDPSTKEFNHHEDPSISSGKLSVNFHNRIRTIYEDSKGNLWIGHDGGHLARFNRSTGEFQFFFHDENDPASLANRRVTSILEDHEGKLWIGTGDGISIFNEEKGDFQVVRKVENNPFSLQDNYIRYIYEDKAHSIWVGTDSYGISVFHRTFGKFNHLSMDSYGVSGLESNTIFCFEEGNDNSVWIGTIGAGLVNYNRSSNHFKGFDREVNKTHESILTLCVSKNELWFGTWGGGLGHYNMVDQTFSEPFFGGRNCNLSNNNILDIEADGQGNLWLATLNGLNFFDGSKKEFTSYSTQDGLPDNALYCLLPSDNGKIWVGTNGGGLALFDPKKRTSKNYKKEDGENSIPNNTVYCLAKGPNGNIWIGTKGGLSKYDPKTGSFENYTEGDGLPSSVILGILFDKRNHLWVSTNNGLMRFDPTDTKDPDVRKYYSIDGLQGDEFNQNAYFKTKDGEMFFGGVNGFNHFYPENIVDNPNIPPVVLTRFLVLGKEFELDSSIVEKKFIELSYRNNFFAFEFAALDFVLPEKNLYSYKMEGVDEEWSVPSTRSFVSYTNLEGGDYVFRVRASNNDGVWNKNGVELHIRIIPPFYKTKLFYSGMIFLTIFSVFIFIRLRVASIKKEKKRLEEMVTQRTRELEEKNQDIMSSIEYAKRIQEAILPDKASIFHHLPESFILYRPKDIVSGDFYWFGVVGSKKIIAAVDCTGHGVPGAFMSMIGHNLLNQIILEKKITDPGRILSELRISVRAALKQEGKERETSDGMDVSLAILDTDSSELHYAGAFRPLVLIKNNSIEKIEGDKSPIGGAKISGLEEYSTHVRKLSPGDTFYMYSDGFVDQFGGPKGKKFMGKNLHQLLQKIQSHSMTEQQFILQESFEEWTGNLEQVDDVLVIGVRYF